MTTPNRPPPPLHLIPIVLDIGIHVDGVVAAAPGSELETAWLDRLSDLAVGLGSHFLALQRNKAETAAEHVPDLSAELLALREWLLKQASHTRKEILAVLMAAHNSKEESSQGEPNGNAG